MSKTIKGINASEGISQAKVLRIIEEELDLSKKIGKPEIEIKTLNQAVVKASEQIKQLITNASKNNLGEDKLAIFNAHLQIANDPSMIDEIKVIIKNQNCNAGYALATIQQKYVNLFSNMDNEYMQERAADIKDVCHRIQLIIANKTEVDLASISEKVILVSDDLTPSQTAILNKEYVLGFATNIGGRTSHAAIMARSLGIPAVLGLKNITSSCSDGDQLIINGNAGYVIINPTEKEIIGHQTLIATQKQEKLLLEKYKNKNTFTKDNQAIEVAGNIGSPKDVAQVNEVGGEAVGLFRSEFLYMDSPEWPTEETQYNAYKEALILMNGKRVVIRTLDIGGDKTLDYFKFPVEMNPFLGYRAIRLCLDRKEIFRTQLRALLRASNHGKLAIMFPLIATVQELKDSIAFLDETKAELTKENITFANDIEIGMMIEVPAAAVIAEKLAKYVDFFSIGTNDLIQYTMAADRMNESVSYLYQPLNPSILTLVNNVIIAGKKHNIWTGMCGEMAGDPAAVSILVGMGIHELSMSASSILRTRALIAKLEIPQVQKLAQAALDCETAEEVQKLVDEFNEKINK